MDRKEFESRKASIYEQAERELGQQLTAESRSEIERIVGSDFHDYKVAYSDLKRYLEDHLAEYKAIVSSYKRENGITSPKKHYDKALRNRLRLVRFIRVRLKNPRRIDWKSITNAWKENYPTDTKSSSVLKAEYHRAKADPNVQREYFAKELTEHINVVKELTWQKVNPEVAEKELQAALADIDLRDGELAVAGTVQFMRLVEGLTPLDKQDVADFSKSSQERNEREVVHERLHSQEG